MSRRFDGTDDRVEWTIGDVSALTHPWTFAMLMKLDTGVSWQGYLGVNDSVNGSDIAMGRHSSGNLGTFGGGGASINQAISHSSSDGWMLLAGTKAGVFEPPRHHKYPVGGAATHTDGATNFIAASGGLDSIVMGEIDGSDFFDGWLAACAIWNVELSDGDIESLVTTLTRANWLSLSPLFLVDELDAFQTDYAGSSTRSSITGTTDDADDPTGWASWADEEEEPLARPSKRIITVRRSRPTVMSMLFGAPFFEEEEEEPPVTTPADNVPHFIGGRGAC